MPLSSGPCSPVDPAASPLLARRTALAGLVKMGLGSIALTVLGADRATTTTTIQPKTTEPVGDGKACLSCDHKVLINGKPAPARTKSNDEARRGDPSRKWVMVIDLAKCDGCGHCIEGCSKMHGVPDNRQWIKVLTMRDAIHTTPYYFPQPCFHCDNPPCTKVCPVDATFKRQDGAVLIDNDRCIGCRFCIAACPYGARSFNWGPPHDPPELLKQPYSIETGTPRKVGTVEKCDFCTDMAEQGLLPACVTSCPMGVIYYGDENEDAVTNGKGQTVRFSTLIRDGAGYRQMEELGTAPRVYYLPPKNRMYEPPTPADVDHE